MVLVFMTFAVANTDTESQHIQKWHYYHNLSVRRLTGKIVIALFARVHAQSLIRVCVCARA